MAVEKYELDTEFDNSGIEEILETLKHYLKKEEIDCELVRWGNKHNVWDVTCHAIKITGNSEYDFEYENIIYISYVNNDGEFLYNNLCGQLLGYFNEDDDFNPFDGVVDTGCEIPDNENEKYISYIDYTTAVEEIKQLVEETVGKEKFIELKSDVKDTIENLIDVKLDNEQQKELAILAAKKLINDYDLTEEDLFEKD